MNNDELRKLCGAVRWLVARAGAGRIFGVRERERRELVIGHEQSLDTRLAFKAAHSAHFLTSLIAIDWVSKSEQLLLWQEGGCHVLAAPIFVRKDWLAPEQKASE